MVMGFILPMVRDLDGKRRYVHVEKKKLRNLKAVVRVHLCALVARPLLRMLCSALLLSLTDRLDSMLGMRLTD